MAQEMLEGRNPQLVIMAVGANAAPAAMIERIPPPSRQGFATPGCQKRSLPLTRLRATIIFALRFVISQSHA